MPELPEVETVRAGLERLLPDRVVSGVVAYESPKSFPNAQSDVNKFLIGASVESIDRRGKALILRLNSNYVLFIHLKMTGQLVFVGSERFGAGHPNGSLIGKLPDKSTRVSIAFKDGSILYFNDQRKFGWMKLLPKELLEKEPFMRSIGPEPLEDGFTDKEFIARVRKRKGTTIKAAILDQSVLAGIGNIYADEGLWGAQIYPARRVYEVTDQELKKLHSELIYVLKLSIEKGGSTNRNYVNAEGKKGSYMDFARVFRREKLPCPRCGTTIEKIRVAGRGTHFCPRCQKLG